MFNNLLESKAEVLIHLHASNNYLLVSNNSI